MPTLEFWNKRKFWKETFCDNCTLTKLNLFLFVESLANYNLELKVDFRSLDFHNKKMIILFRVRLEMSFEKWIFVLFFISELSALNFHCFLIVICGVIITSITSLLDGLLDFGQEPTTILQYHNFKSKLSKDAKIS